MFLKVKKQRKCKYSLFLEAQKTVSHSRVFGWKIGIWCPCWRTQGMEDQGWTFGERHIGSEWQ